MDPVIIAGAGPVGLALALALARAEVPVILLDESSDDDERRPARTAVLRPDTAALLEGLGCRAGQAAVPWTGWRTMRRRQVVRRLTLVPGGLFPLGPAGGHGGPDSRGYDVGYVRDGGQVRENGPGGQEGGLGGFSAGFSSGPEGDETEEAAEAAESELASPLHLPQHELTRALRTALAAVPGENLVRIISGTRLDTLEQDARGVSI
ncbi:FAD-dependent monooxygenase, partial [Streptomyces sp. MCAF7]